MFGYPKTFLGEVWKLVQSGDLPVPDKEDNHWLRSWAQENLTCDSQAKFLLAEMGYRLDDPKDIHFLDLGRMVIPNYVSMGLLVGLVRTVGRQTLSVSHIPDYLTNTGGLNPDQLYGRGFGYSGELSTLQASHSQQMPSEDSIQGAVRAALTAKPNLLIIANTEVLDANPATRLSIVEELSKAATRVAIVHSGDIPLDPAGVDGLSGFGTLFLREIPTA